jgi:S1-C subfamily serine protease
MYTNKGLRIRLYPTILVLVLVAAGCSPIYAATQPTSVPAPATPTAATTPPVTATPAPASQAASATVAADPPAAPLSASDFGSAIRLVAQKVKPAVVQITNEQSQVDQFNQPFDVPAGVGSGVIYDKQGHILTNNHVVEGAQQLLVALPDGRSFQAKLIGRDPMTDLAVVQISGSNLPIADLGDSNQLQVGDWVVAIGNALALDGGPTVTAGVVSALGRTVQEPSDTSAQGPYLFDVIQTSAPINPGNSGGPLVNLAGQVVGINTLVAGQAEPGVPAQGIGFAISLAAAKPIADQLVATGKVIYPYLGLSDVDLNPAIAAQLRITEQEGIVIRRVARGSPADTAGLQRLDVITAVDGKSLPGDSELQRMLRDHKPGDTLTLSVIRGTQKLTVKVVLGEAPSP